MQESLQDVLGQYVQRSHYSYGQLAALSGLPQKTIANWLDGTVRKPQKWQGLVNLADVLHLNESETNRLLEAARHSNVFELRETITAVDDVALLASWPSKEPPPFIPIADLPSFVGREAELVDLANALQQGIFVNVCNVAGDGRRGQKPQAAVCFSATFLLHENTCCLDF